MNDLPSIALQRDSVEIGVGMFLQHFAGIGHNCRSQDACFSFKNVSSAQSIFDQKLKENLMLRLTKAFP